MTVYEGSISEILDLLVVSLLAISAYNILELLWWIFDFFKRWSGLYFWSILAGALSMGAFTAVTIHSTFRDDSPMVDGICLALLYPCVQTAAALVLYSRLHLITQGRILTFTRWLIIVSCIGLYIPYIVMMSGISTGDRRFYRSQQVKVTAITCSLVRELFICGIYIYESLQQIKAIVVIKGRTGRRVMIHLILANAAVVGIDVILLMTLPYTCVSQTLKLKIEFGILNKLLELLGTPMNSINCGRSPGQLNEQGDSQVGMMRETGSDGTGSSTPLAFHCREPV
ncbi:hypothetical protein ASPSYDRAFT_901272 [Aspergillus sydowii CBS 593.65]|uniref:DUF7703 domain-containing protein n=1 Tax=Aspergillus sydowii CBS 593.65 TaxID=1036612 RepID=A0A1L9TKB6_9EURO|nr:uncharacterized protein ASPSYDRAFT_901272 [Aspergillus sydowii CBS 593.65]OJJ59821.1 hypothetical protein ASPSYDRAFT_901272 [Aspergillus sydowii CBS 593.65]